MAVIADALAPPPSTANTGSHLVVIAREDWVRALNGFTQRHDGWLVSLDVIPPGGTPQREFENLPLLGVSSDGPAVEGTVTISVSWSRSEHLTHIAPSVRRLSIEQTVDGADAALWMDASDGSRTVLRFRVAALPETVDGFVRSLSRDFRKRGRS